MSEELLFVDDFEDEAQAPSNTWKVLIVDDEPEIHVVTKLALSDFKFMDMGIEFISAHSGKEAKELLMQHNDIALVLLDVVMETDDAGLKVAQFIRSKSNNPFTRIILRTGQPGQAPERQVILNYDINDYKSKTELTAQKLFTSVISSLRSYRDIILLEQSRRALEQVITSSSQLFRVADIESFMKVLAQQCFDLLSCQPKLVYLSSHSANPTAVSAFTPYVLYSGKGVVLEEKLSDAMCEKVSRLCENALAQKEMIMRGQDIVLFTQKACTNPTLMVVSGLPDDLSPDEKRTVDIFFQNTQAAFERVQLSQEKKIVT